MSITAASSPIPLIVSAFLFVNFDLIRSINPNSPSVFSYVISMIQN